MVPVGAPEFEYLAPPDLGGRRANYPILHSPTPAMAREMKTDWQQTVWNRENVGIVGVEVYEGDVWSIQLTARPGYYVAPEIMQRNAVQFSDEGDGLEWGEP